MIKRETYSLLAMIEEYYEQFQVDQSKLDLWHEALKENELEELKQNLMAFVRVSPYPPKVSDLFSKAPAGRTIPGLDETKRILSMKKQPASADVIVREGSKIKEILGIAK